jgi:hypothetical protein
VVYYGWVCSDHVIMSRRAEFSVSRAAVAGITFSNFAQKFFPVHVVIEFVVIQYT